MSTPNFTQCGITFTSNLSLYSNYTWTGPAEGIWANGQAPPLITLAGCEALCGTGNEYYGWSASATTVLTWVMPVLSMLTKAPFEKKQTVGTWWTICRWLGSPIVCLSYTLWNLKITSKCAKLVDMATPYDVVPPADSEFADMRDSLYLLACMNQFSLKPGLPPIESERLLRIMLFSDNLKLVKDEDSLKSLAIKRRKLAHEFRAYRKRGMVPVFISFFPFLFALGVTLENAFGDVGAVATAHDLAIGLLVSWFPILILTSIVDKNILPAATGPARLKLNNLLESVRRALLDENLRNTYMKEENRTPDDFAWTAVLKDYNFGGKAGFFVSQAGQGRVRWHYGVANPIVTGIEEAFVAKKGRGWLGASAVEVQIARTALVLGPERGFFVEGLKFFDPREFWEVLSAPIIVFGTIGGAWILSYFTPTLGLGCRSGGYTVFFIIASGMAIFEALSWWLIPEPLGTLSPRYMRMADLPPANSSIGRFIQRLRITWNNDPRSIFQTYIMRPMEVTNLGWLLYIVFAQVLGSYQNCRCLASVWAGKGGYVDFESQEYYKEHGIVLYWATGTAISLFIMVSGLFYTIIEWCTQSHMNTLEYDDMMRGLMRIRTFKKVTLPLVMPFHWLLMAFGLLFDNIVPRRYQPRGRPSLNWSPWMKQTSITDILEAQLQIADGPKEVQGLKSEKSVRVRMIENGQ